MDKYLNYLQEENNNGMSATTIIDKAEKYGKNAKEQAKKKCSSPKTKGLFKKKEVFSSKVSLCRMSAGVTGWVVTQNVIKRLFNKCKNLECKKKLKYKIEDLQININHTKDEMQKIIKNV